MKKILSALLCAALLTGCAANLPAEPIPASLSESTAPATPPIASPEYTSRFNAVTDIVLSDDGILVDALDSGEKYNETVFVTHDIICYEDRDTYESGNPYGEGTDSDKHTAAEAASHTVVNITAPGAYRITGKLSAGQIRIDLGENACKDPNAVVELILDDADITCTVAPAILFLNTYECDENWSPDTAKAEVDTSAAGANLILKGDNVVSGSYVAKIFRDRDGEKKLWKQDGAIYSYMSMNVFGPGYLELNAANEGLDTELHLTINSGNITINSQNDGINTNEDNVSVTTINGGNLTIFAGLGAEGDGIDSNGYLVINGGTVVSSAKPIADAGLDSDLGSFIHGGTVIAMGSTMDWAESDSGQVTMNLQFAQQQKAGSKIVITREDGTEIFSFEDDGPHSRGFSGLILSHAAFTRDEVYHVYVNGVQMAYTGTDVGGFPGGFGGRPGAMPEGFDPENMPEGFDFENIPEGFEPGRMPGNFDPENMPEGFDPSQMDGRGQCPEGDRKLPSEGFEGKFPEGMAPPEMPEGGFDPRQQSSMPAGEASTEFYMNDMVNFFSGVSAAE